MTAKQTIAYQETGYFSKLMCDYLSGNEKLLPFYSRFPNIEAFKAQIEEKQSSYQDAIRNTLVSSLKKQYELVDVSNETKSNLDLLAAQNTFTITTGHQLNLFTGPLYFLYKIVSVINLAKQLKTTYPGYNFVPVYWMASEDHDFEEINYFNFKGKKVQWNKTASGAVGELDTKGLEEVFQLYASQLGLGDNANQLKTWFEKAYLKHDNLADATFYLANELFKSEGLIIIDANTKALKSEFIPHIKKEILEQASFEIINKTSKALNEIDEAYKIQVNPRAVNFFYINKEVRERIVFEDELYKVLNTAIQFTKEELLVDIDANPQCYSPNVVLRPLYQEVILPNLCYVGGGGEMAYWFQLKDNFKNFNVPFPLLLLRNSALIQTKRQFEKTEKLQLTTKDLFLKQLTLVEKVTKAISDIEIDFSAQKKHLEQQFEALYSLALKTDASFKGAVLAQERKQIKGLEQLEKRLLTAQKRKMSDVLDRVKTLQNELFVNKSLQERQANFSEFYLEYGELLIPKLLENLAPLEQEFTVLTF